MTGKRCSLHNVDDRRPHTRIPKTKRSSTQLKHSQYVNQTLAHLNNPTRTCMTASKNGIHLFSHEHSPSPSSKKREASHVDIIKFPDWYSPYTENPSTTEPKTAPATPTVMNVKNTSRANTSLDPRSFSFEGSVGAAAMAAYRRGVVVSAVDGEGVGVGDGCNPSSTRGYTSPPCSPVIS